MKVLVTGGTRGIGRAIALSFLGDGHEVTITGRGGGCDLEEQGAQYIKMNFDEPIPKFFDDIDILVNNAGEKHYQPAVETTDAQMIYAFNLLALVPFDLATFAYPYMASRHWGRIINIASISAMQGARNSVPYVMAKHALLGITRCLATEWAKDGITVNAIAPGFIATNMLSMVPDLARIPIGRVGTPQDVAGVVKFLCSPMANYITGICLPVDGGWLAR